MNTPRHRFWITPCLLGLILLLLVCQFFFYGPRWEYRFGHFGNMEDPAALAKEMNGLGAQGWELVTADIVSWGTPDNDPTEIRAVLRRRVR